MQRSDPVIGHGHKWVRRESVGIEGVENLDRWENHGLIFKTLSESVAGGSLKEKQQGRCEAFFMTLILWCPSC